MSVSDNSATQAIKQAESLIAVGRPGEAIQRLRAAASSGAPNAELGCWLSLALLRASQPTEALRIAQQAAAHAPEWEWPYRLQAFALIQLRRTDQALSAAEHALSLDPAKPEVQLIVAEANLACGRAAAAAAMASHLIERVPNYPQGFDVRGRAALRLKRFLDAEADFREALRFAPDNWAFNNSLGVALRAQRRHKEAVEAFGRALKLDPNAKVPRRNLNRELLRVTRLDLFHAAFAVGPVVGVLGGLVIMGWAEVPWLLVWIVNATVLMVIWILVAQRLWRQTVLPRVQAHDTGRSGK